jgi:hypothetical protein
MTTRRHFTAWMATGSSVLDQPCMDVTIIEDELLGADPDNETHWSDDTSKPQPFYAVTTVNAKDGDAQDGINEAEALMRAAGWRVAGQWRDTSSAYVATVERDEEEATAGRYTVRTNPMPEPLRTAMTSLLRSGARVRPEDAYPDTDGHHLIARRGAVQVHAVLALDHHADGVDWADGDMSWTVTRDGAPVECARWSQVCATLREAEGGEQ